MDEFEKIVEKWIGKIKDEYLFFGDDSVVSDFKNIALNAFNAFNAFDGSIPSHNEMFDLIYEKYSVDREILEEWMSLYKESTKECLDS